MSNKSIDILIAQNAQLLEQNRQLIAMLQQSPAPRRLLSEAEAKRPRKLSTREALTAYAYDHIKDKNLQKIFLQIVQKRYK